MRVAICLAGYFNSLTDPTSKGVDGFEHLYKHVISKVDKVDVYAHSWDIQNEQLIRSTYKDYLKELVVEPQLDFNPQVIQNGLDTFNHGHYSHPRITFSQFYSVQRSFDLLVQSGEQYDVVIKARYDIGRINRNTSYSYPVQCINFDPQRDMEQFYTANWPYLNTEGPADMWFYSSLDNMKSFAYIYDIMLRDYKPGTAYAEFAGSNDGGLINAIKFYKWFLIQTGLWDKKQLLDTTWE